MSAADLCICRRKDTLLMVCVCSSVVPCQLSLICQAFEHCQVMPARALCSLALAHCGVVHTACCTNPANTMMQVMLVTWILHKYSTTSSQLSTTLVCELYTSPEPANANC